MKTIVTETAIETIGKCISPRDPAAGTYTAVLPTGTTVNYRITEFTLAIESVVDSRGVLQDLRTLAYCIETADEADGLYYQALAAYHRVSYITDGSCMVQVDPWIDAPGVLSDMNEAEELLLADEEGFLFHKRQTYEEVYYACIDASKMYLAKIRQCIRIRRFNDPVFEEFHIAVPCATDGSHFYYPLKALFVPAATRYEIYRRDRLPELTLDEVKRLLTKVLELANVPVTLVAIS